MKHTVCWVTGTVAVALMIVCVWLIAASGLSQPQQPYSLQLIMIGMMSGVAGSAFGAIAFMTYMPPWEREEWKLVRAQRRSARLK